MPLSAAEAAKILARTPVHTPSADASPQVAPSPRIPTVGIPTPPLTDGHPKKDPGDNTSHHPAEPERKPDPAPKPEPAPEATGTTEPPEAARSLVAALPHLSPDLRRIPRGMHDELTRLVARWLTAGHTPTAIRTHILRGLPDDGTPVHRPGGLLRYLLRDVPPAPGISPASEQPSPTRPPSRLAALRECEGDHVQATLFRPTGDETRCPRCLTPPPHEGSRCASPLRRRTATA
ncbi:hypothetical protein [Streptomyces sp. SCL15-6]|uniref:hypothetical protein n=1 Tax=Streptomyces sp. SCL15-6 TaxID=2967222 RepID=UPI0029671891|nr:hypothetical protein [Streptomyces sp. SCL15-6]